MILAALLLVTDIRESDRELAERLQRRETQAMADLYDRFGRHADGSVGNGYRDDHFICRAW